MQADDMLDTDWRERERERERGEREREKTGESGIQHQGFFCNRGM